MSKIKKTSLVAGLAAVLLSLGQVSSAFAWGPERDTYTMDKPADHPTFNSITNNNVLGDERDFVRIREKGTENKFTSDLEIEAGKQYLVSIYYHNNASATYNDKAHNYQGVALQTKMSSSFPTVLKAGEQGEVLGKISSTNATPQTVWDEARITAKEDMTLHFVASSAQIFNSWGTNERVLPTALFSEDGVYLGINELDGIVLGCAEYSGSVLYTIQTVADGDPIPDDVEDPTPTEEEKPTPVLPSELPKTGPMEITLIVIVAVLAIVALGYAIHARRAAHKAAKSRKNKGSKKK